MDDGSNPPPWEVQGRPYGLTEEHFGQAWDVWASRDFASVGDDELVPAQGTWGRYDHCAGNQYSHNQLRIGRLLARQPPYRSLSGQPLYPAVLTPDPSPAYDDARPLAAITVEGYVGSAWGALATRLAPQVERWLRPDWKGRRTFCVTVVRFQGKVPEIWVPGV